MTYSLNHRPKGHPFELPRYSYELCRKSFVLRRLYEFKWFFGSLFIFLCVTIALIFFCFSARTSFTCSR